MNNDNDGSRTLNDKYFECRVDCLGKLTLRHLNASFENQGTYNATTTSTSRH